MLETCATREMRAVWAGAGRAARRRPPACVPPAAELVLSQRLHLHSTGGCHVLGHFLCSVMRHFLLPNPPQLCPHQEGGCLSYSACLWGVDDGWAWRGEAEGVQLSPRPPPSPHPLPFASWATWVEE